MRFPLKRRPVPPAAAQAVLAALTQLEIFGLVKVHPGRRFSL